MREIAVEANLALAGEALESRCVAGGAAPAVRALSQRMIPRLAASELATSKVGLAAEILAQGGTAVMLVRPNVLCTKTFNEYGPCTRGGGGTDIGNCQTGCTHRLELAAAADDHKASVRQIVNEMTDAGDHMRTWWLAQLRHHCDALLALGHAPDGSALAALGDRQAGDLEIVHV